MHRLSVHRLLVIRFEPFHDREALYTARLVLLCGMSVLIVTV